MSAGYAKLERGSVVPYIEVFLYLQLLDFFTTVIGIRLGAQEGSPLTRWLINAGPVIGVAVSKLLACAAAGYCIWRGKQRIILWSNYWYAALIIWNLTIILQSLAVL